MEEKDRIEIYRLLEEYLDESLSQIVVSNPADQNKIAKVKMRPLLLKGSVVYQAEEFVGKQVFHKNLTAGEAVPYLTELLADGFRQLELSSSKGQARVLISKKGTVTVKRQKSVPSRMVPSADWNHNRQKHYILEEGKPVPYLQDLGVMTQEGKIVRSRYDKYRQINRFLEFIEDVLPHLDRSRETTIIDFGCGKSYLTFAMYHYLRELRGYPVRIIGLDLKEDVIERCNQLAERYGYERLHFYHGDIASFEGVDHVDMVVTLHACDTATDYALHKAVSWGASVILSVPCCQHELNRQMSNPLMAPVFRYGLIKERMAALYTDALRAELLEYSGYRTQLLEFIEMEHTPKNILIRAVKQGGPKDNRREITELMEFLGVEPTLAKLLL